VALLFVLAALPFSIANAASVILTWNRSSGDVAGYTVYYGKYSRNYQNEVVVKNNNSCTISGLDNSTTYYFAVTAYDSRNNESNFSRELSYKTLSSGSGPCDAYEPGPSWCQECGPCSQGQGDCDNDAECQSGLICAKDVGAKYGGPANMDVCERPDGGAIIIYNAYEPDPHWCRDYGPCPEGQGDCDSDAECQSGLICAKDVGAKYGGPANMDVCVSP
jgi:hypothetical protein